MSALWLIPAFLAGAASVVGAVALLCYGVGLAEKCQDYDE